MSELPKGWATAGLGELGTWRGGGTPSKGVPTYWEDGTIPWVSPKDMKVNRLHDSEDHITQEALEQSATKMIPSGSVLFVTRSGILAHTFPVATTAVDVTVNQDIKALSPFDGMLVDYIAWAARALGTQILHQCSKDGTTVASVDTEKLHSFEVPIAPLPEQKRIVEAIESYFTRLDDAVATLERAQRTLKRYRASVLKAAVEGRLVPTEAERAREEGRGYEPASVLLERILVERRRRWEEAERAKMEAKGQVPKDERWKAKYQAPTPPDTTGLPELPEGWCWATVETVGEVLLGRQRAPQYLTGRFNHPYLRVANIKDDHIALDDVLEMDFEGEHFEKYSLQAGDVLVSEGQSPELVGQSAIYRGGIKGLCFQKTLHRFRPVEGGPSSEYAQIVFRSHVKNGLFRRLASITTNIAHLTLIKFCASPFPLPPAPEQDRIAEEVDRLLTVAEAMERAMRKETLRLARLRQSILKWAFEGKLADQNPLDEPAADLLERIRASRTHPTKSGRGRPKKEST